MSSKGILDDSPALDKNDGNIPAFPVYPRVEAGKSSQINGAVGMTLRDYFAIHASDADVDAYLKLIQKRETVLRSPSGECKVIYAMPDNARSIARLMFADAMLKERAK